MYFVSPVSKASLTNLSVSLLSIPPDLLVQHGDLSTDELVKTVGTPVNEGPQAMYHGGKTCLSISASYCWTSSYALGLLTWNGGDLTKASSWAKAGPFLTSVNSNMAAVIMDKWTRSVRKDVFASADGPKHRFFQSPDATQIWNVYHATALMRLATGQGIPWHR